MSQHAIVRGLLVAALALLATDAAMADTFGTGDNQFTIDFVSISGSTNPASGIPAGTGFTFTGVNNDYRMGAYETTNDQWTKFEASLGVPVTGSPSSAYAADSLFPGASVPTDFVSWYEAAQFVNWLNTSTNHQAAYKFTGTQGTSDYTFVAWSTTDAGYDAGNPYRNTAAEYFLPTENEWVKAAYWNGTALQTYATRPGDTLFRGNGTNGGWNYYNRVTGADPPADAPWNVGSGSQELNGTYDMMGNLSEWLEGPWNDGDYDAASRRAVRSGRWDFDSSILASSSRGNGPPEYAAYPVGFRVASIPEPGSIVLLVAGAASLLIYACLRRKRMT
jgi:formylglycine-generating enzyme